VEIRHGAQRAVVVEVGGGIRHYEAGGWQVLDGYRADQMVTAARGQPLIPWPNRLHTGRYSWDGTEHRAPLNEPEQDNAIHGVTRWLSWTAEEVGESAATMHLVLLPRPAYPFALDLAVRYELGDAGLTVTTTARNIGDADAPYGHGAHPYLTAGTELVDDAELHVPAASWLPTGPAQIPIGTESVEGTPYDFRQPRPIRRVHLDYAFTDLERDAAGRAVLTLAGPNRRVQLWVDEHYPYLEVFTGDTVPEPDRRRRGLGVEPMTCPPDAFRTGQDVVRLRPGGTFTSRWGILV
jgi:aldose 1-epimerase